MNPSPMTPLIYHANKKQLSNYLFFISINIRTYTNHDKFDSINDSFLSNLCTYIINLICAYLLADPFNALRIPWYHDWVMLLLYFVWLIHLISPKFSNCFMQGITVHAFIYIKTKFLFCFNVTTKLRQFCVSNILKCREFALVGWAMWSCCCLFQVESEVATLNDVI